MIITLLGLIYPSEIHFPSISLITTSFRVSFRFFPTLLIGKLIVWGKDRNTAIKRMNRALNECAITGIPTTINFHLTLLNKSKFKQGKIHTKYVEEELLPNY